MHFPAPFVCTSPRTSTFLTARRSAIPTTLLLIGFVCSTTSGVWSEQNSSTYDGPAELPRATVASKMADTPAKGSIRTVNAEDDLQATLNSAQCGDVVELQAGATFSGPFTVPAKKCDDQHWIVIRTSADDSLLPAESKRATPCYAGVSSLAGRPQYPCDNPQNVMAQVQMAIPGDGPFVIADGANHYRFLGLEIMRPEGVDGLGRLVSGLGTADHLVFDRLWLHGATQDETVVGLSLTGMSNVAAVDSYFSDFHCISVSGLCTDSHAIGGGLGATQDGPFLIQDNFLEASTEGILLGGGKASKSPSDITVQNNHFWKPWHWMPGSQGYIGGKDGRPFVVKNHFELKNAVRVLVQNNLMENNWGGFTQDGYAVLLTPANQYTKKGKGVCPQCQVTDVTIRYNQISHAGAGILMANPLTPNRRKGKPALAGERYSIHDVVIDDLSTQYTGGGAGFAVDNSWPKNALNSITINHVTVFPDPGSHLMITANMYKNQNMYGFVFTNNLIITGEYPIWNAFGKHHGKSSCAEKNVPKPTLNACFDTYTFQNNGLISNPPQYKQSDWPNKNYFPATPEDVGFVNFNGGNGGNYELLSTSPYKNKGTDGKDLGADIAGLNAALVNVQ